MNLLHVDHATSSTGEGHVVVAMFEPHDVGSPRTTLTKGWTCDLYSSRTIDFFGANTSAEW